MEDNNTSKKATRATLILQDGSKYEGFSFGAEKNISGECVFQTGMVGYVESLTDPSYRGQLLVLTFPLIGNYGVTSNEVDSTGIPLFMESNAIHVAALLVADYSDEKPSHWNSIKTLSQWLKEYNVPGVYGLDTRAIVKRIRDRGAMLGKIVIHSSPNAEKDLQSTTFVDPNKVHLVAEVSTKQIQVFNPAGITDGSNLKTVVAVDCGMKWNQIRSLLKRGVRVKVVPWNHDFTKEKDYDGVFISNGPGDPIFCEETINNLKLLISAQNPKPVFGICLGHQLLGLAAGGKTFKMKFGNRGHNQPCVDLTTGRCHLTSQNHGYALEPSSLPADWEPYFYNANDDTNEGIRHKTKPFFSVQFHPEAKGGPAETEFLFDKFICMVKNVPFSHPLATTYPSTHPGKINKVLILGSGGLSIGQAGEFDYSGSQAIKAFKEEGVQTILINPNIATVQTTTGLADKIYFLPVTPEFVTRILEKEKPDGIVVTFGGQTALNCGIELYKRNVFEQLNVKVLGTPIEAIIATEDREIFAQKMGEIGEKIAPSTAVRTVDEALVVAEKIGYPVIIRAAFALGGLGSGFASTPEQLRALVTKALAVAEQVLVERSMKGWKEIEYEVVRDYKDNCITVTNMENFDPLGIHTGESIVVAPSQTLTDTEYQMLRSVSIKVIRHIGVVGECNIQFALNPESEEYCIIEVNARLSRSSALASKATGYPLAFVAAKLALGIELPKLRNSVTKVTTACFEPSLDYLVVKIPVWDLKKFERVDTKIDTAMKSVGEVMSIGRNFEEAIQKAVRMTNTSVDGFQAGVVPSSEDELEHPSDNRIYVLASALKSKMTVDRINYLTKIDKWFLNRLKRISDLDDELSKHTTSTVPLSLIVEAKQRGFADRQIARCLNTSEIAVRSLRKSNNILPFVKQIDTVAAEVVAQNNYLYTTYNGCENDVQFADHGYMVIGSGGYRIGSSVEFDWCAVGTVMALKKMDCKTIMVNFNPETVSTDYDVCDRLYFEELSLERVLDIYELEDANGVIISMGGQIPNNLALPLWRQNVKILGTSPEMIDVAENRYKFSRLLDSIGVDQPRWKELTNLGDIRKFCEEVGYPILVRPSYVLSGAAMNVVHSYNDLEAFLKEATEVSREHPVVISKFIEYAKEIEMDAVARDGELVMHCISEHVENAGVHSGDATLVFPSQDLDKETIQKVEEATRKIVKALHVSGPFNIQFLAKDNQIKVIECNLRASRSFPFVSKTMQYSLIDLATRVIMKAPVKAYPSMSDINYVGVKVAQFSFSRLRGADPILGVEMASTGEVACFGTNRHEAFLKALLSTAFKLPKQNILVSIGAYKEKMEFLPFARKLVDLGYCLFSSPGTADFLSAHDVPVSAFDWPEDDSSTDSAITQNLTKNSIHLAIVCPSTRSYKRSASFLSRGYLTRRRAIDFNIPLITNIKFAKLLVDSLALVKTHHNEIPIGLPDSRNSRRIVLLPGLIDVHVHVREPGQEHKEDWDTCTAAALSGGFTAIAAMPNTNPSIVDSESFELVHNIAANKSRCDYGIYVGASATNAASIPKLAPSAFGLKMYLNHTFSTLKMDDLGHWMAHFQNWPRDAPICCHAEGPHLAAVLLLAHLHDRHVHICHVSRKDEIEIIKSAKQKKIKVTCEVSPHHLFLTEADIARLGEKRSRVAPKLASPEDQKALWENMDIIDCFATDHAPHTPQEKDSETPPPGYPGLETALPLLLTAVSERRLTLDDIVLRYCTNPRKIFNIPEQLDTYVEVDLDCNWKIPESLPFSKAKWTPFANRSVTGKVLRVVLRGETAYLDGKVLAPIGFGKDIRKIVPTLPVVQSPRTPPKPIMAPSTVIKPTVVSESISEPTVVAPKETVPVMATKDTPLRQSTSMTKLSILGTDISILSEGFYAKNILSVKQFNRENLHSLFNMAQEMKLVVRRAGSIPLLKGKVLATVFFEPSTRTQCSFLAAMERLGGSTIALNEQASSIQKGESLGDTIRTIESYADAIVIRHPQEGSAQLASSFARKPIINAGDGIGEHPTQALLDVFTIREELGTVNGLIITLVGDLKHGRTVHSLVKLLALYNVQEIHYVSPPSLQMPQDIVQYLSQKGIKQTEHTTLDKVLPLTDVLYVTRIQKERFVSIEEYDKVKDYYCITPKTMTLAKPKMIVMHPLPRVNEIATEVDADPRAAYFRQMENGMFVRMALLAMVMGKP